MTPSRRCIIPTCSICGHSDPGGQRLPPARREPPFGRYAVKRPLPAFQPSRWAGRRYPAQREGGLQHRSRLRMEPAVLRACDGCSCTRRAFHCLPDKQ
ncbi:hypothetical protein NDU88_009726 [Pleurodeles waltl]|uniref:Uncharacterized protein n=1 Tax=Pleurodeles waltl TaxID=8319 RepID=A0AAV7QVG0_PLEWA|nr:hypothetical protein NDU88_009726 [Pleurodeles waltl]